MDRIDPAAGDLVAAFEAAVTVEERLAVLRSRYRVEPVPADHAFEDDAVYFVVGGRKNYLIRTLSPAIADGRLHFHAWPGGTPMQPLALDRLAAAVALQRILQVHPKPADMAERDRILDVGGFSQLVEAAQRSGLVPGIATIIQVRDCEFRLGKHMQALQLMESLLQAFVVKAGQRSQQLAREDQEIASGRLRMSPRELQAKRARDRQQTQAIERARTRFMRVVEGLRTIVQRGL
jgi:hypothetical protein